MADPLRVVDASALEPAAGVEELMSRYHGAVAFHLPGRDRSRARVVITLLHGNEPSGARAVARLLADGIEPAVDSLLVLGALEAATARPLFGHRFLPGRLDRNRVFGPERLARSVDHPDYAFATALVDLIGSLPVEALVDLHNNTGHNPAYGIAQRPASECLGLVSLFTELSIISDLKLDTLMEATDGPFPAVSVEVGRVGDPGADEVALAGTRRFLEMPELGPPDREMTLYDTPIRVELAPGTTVAFSPTPVSGPDIVFSDEIDQHNFTLVPRGTGLAWVNSERWPLRSPNNSGHDVSRELFMIDSGVLRPRADMVPIMMTLDDRVAEQDCLFYVVRSLVSA